jgi:hypothetical protein
MRHPPSARAWEAVHASDRKGQKTAPSSCLLQSPRLIALRESDSKVAKLQRERSAAFDWNAPTGGSGATARGTIWYSLSKCNEPKVFCSHWLSYMVDHPSRQSVEDKAGHPKACFGSKLQRLGDILAELGKQQSRWGVPPADCRTCRRHANNCCGASGGLFRSNLKPAHHHCLRVKAQWKVNAKLSSERPPIDKQLHHELW